MGARPRAPKTGRTGPYDRSVALGTKGKNANLRRQCQRTAQSHRWPHRAKRKTANPLSAVRSKRGYSVNIYDAIAARRPKSIRCQLRRKYEQKKIGNTSASVCSDLVTMSGPLDSPGVEMVGDFDAARS